MFEKITDADLLNKGNVGMPDIPNLSTTEMQAKLDELSRDVIIPKFNKLAEELSGEGAAENIGVTPPENFESKTLQPLLNEIALIVLENESKSHEHSNKDELDTITTDKLTAWSRLVELFKNITNVADSISDSTTSIPTSHAVVDYMEVLGNGDMLKAVYDSNNNGIVDNAEKLGGQSPSYYQPKTDSTLKTTSKTTTGAINEVYNSTADNTQFIDNLNIVFGTAYSDSTISSTTLGIRIPDLAAVKLNTVFKVTTSMPITSSDISVVFVTGNASMQERSQTFTLYAKGFNDSLFKVSQLSSGRTYSFTMQQNSPNILILLDEMKGIGNSPESFSYESTDKAFSTYGAYLLQKDINKCLPVSKGAVTDSTVTINLEANAMYICYIKTVKVSDGKLYGHRVNMIYVNNEVGVSGEMTAKPSSVNLEASSNLGFTGTLAVSDDNLHATYALTVSATYKIYYALYKIIQ